MWCYGCEVLGLYGCAVRVVRLPLAVASVRPVRIVNRYVINKTYAKRCNVSCRVTFWRKVLAAAYLFVSNLKFWPFV